MEIAHQLEAKILKLSQKDSELLSSKPLDNRAATAFRRKVFALPLKFSQHISSSAAYGEFVGKHQLTLKIKKILKKILPAGLNKREKQEQMPQLLHACFTHNTMTWI